MRHIMLGLGVAVVLSGCGDPLRDVARLGDVSVDAGAASVAQTPAEARNTGGGLFGRLLNRQPDDPTNAAVEAALDDADIVVDGEPIVIEDPIVLNVPETTTPRGGLFGLFRGTASAQSDPELEVVAVIPDPTPAEVVALAVPEATVAQPDRAPRRGLAGFFNRNLGTPAPRTGPDALDVEAGVAMPFGEIARVCGLRANELGSQIENNAGFRIFDTNPGSTTPRAFYVTGFDDECARTFTGAVVVTGNAETHEFVRYRSSNERIDFTTTDNAYEALKASVCRVPAGQPCGERLARMERNTQFITVYNFFGGTFSSVPTQWAQILVHDGEVLAMSIKDGS